MKKTIAAKWPFWPHVVFWTIHILSIAARDVGILRIENDQTTVFQSFINYFSTPLAGYALFTLVIANALLLYGIAYFLPTKWLPNLTKPFQTTLVLIGVFGLYLSFRVFVFVLRPIFFDLIEFKPTSLHSIAVFIERMSGLDWYLFINAQVFHATMFISLGLAYRYLREKSQEYRERLALEQQRNQIETAFLRSQINPHFLFNILTYFYSQTKDAQPAVAEGVLRLSEMMRFALGEADVKGKILIKNELEQIKNFIELQKLRFGDTLCAHFEIIGNPKNQTIIPLAMLTLVENAFKYGDLHDPENPLVIQAEIKNEQLVFQVQNRIKPHQARNSSGIGLKNLRRRLENAYPNNYVLNIHADDEDFVCELSVPLPE